MKSIKVLMAALMLVAFSFASCSKDDEETGVTEGNVTVTVDGKNKNFTVSSAVMASVQAVNNSNAYQSLVIVSGGGTSQTDYELFEVIVHASKIENKKYIVPAYDKLKGYDDAAGLALGVYTNSAQEVYMAFGLEGSSGSVTITSVTNTSAKGSYDMVLVNRMDNTKKITIKGEFNAKIASSVTVK